MCAKDGRRATDVGGRVFTLAFHMQET